MWLEQSEQGGEGGEGGHGAGPAGAWGPPRGLRLLPQGAGSPGGLWAETKELTRVLTGALQWPLWGGQTLEGCRAEGTGWVQAGVDGAGPAQRLGNGEKRTGQ